MNSRGPHEDTEKVNETETPNFFIAVKNLLEARHAGLPADEFLDELEIIALHSDQHFLRKRAQQIVAEYRTAQTAR